MIDVFVSLQKYDASDQILEKLLDQREKRLHNCLIWEYLMAWKGLLLIDATYESKALI